MHAEDTGVVAEIHAQAFSRQHSSEKWIASNFAAFPRIMIFVARDEQDNVIGYIQWIHKSGFRQEAVIELEQIAILKTKQHPLRAMEGRRPRRVVPDRPRFTESARRDV